jgi:uncharacterized protein
MPKRRPRHQPLRTCAVCRQVREKQSMTRVVRATDGTVSIDPTGRAPGRGTYICSDPGCRDPKRLTEGIKRALASAVVPGALEFEEEHAAT